jgi:HrpA-like RNA helicase
MKTFPIESSSLITITTHEFLLHTLISGDYLLKSSITHLIIDDVHKRSHVLDMLLAYLKDTQHKFRYLKIIFIQTTIQYDTLVKYFGNVATYTSILCDSLLSFFLRENLLFYSRNKK